MYKNSSYKIKINLEAKMFGKKSQLREEEITKEFFKLKEAHKEMLKDFREKFSCQNYVDKYSELVKELDYPPPVTNSEAKQEHNQTKKIFENLIVFKKKFLEFRKKLLNETDKLSKECEKFSVFGERRRHYEVLIGEYGKMCHEIFIFVHPLTDRLKVTLVASPPRFTPKMRGLPKQ